MKILILLLIPFLTIAQQEVPEKYWINDASFEASISGKGGFEDDQPIVVVEFWAEFNKENCFDDWNKIKNAKYYRVDIAKAPNARKRYRIRMAPTIVIFKEGIKQYVFKAGLDLLFPSNLNEIQESINKAKQASNF